MERYSAIAATGVVLNVHTGEVMAMASLPDFDPNDPVDALKPDRLNRMTAGVYELGSVFKSFTFAMALDSGAVDDGRHASTPRKPIHVGGFTIHDFHGKHRPLTVPEVFIYSSNIGAARMALKVGTPGSRHILKPLRPVRPSCRPTCRKWPRRSCRRRGRTLTTMTIAFGHGIAVTPHADGGRRRRAGQRRLAHPADLRAAHRGARRTALAMQVVKPADQRPAALPLPPQCR